MEWTTRDDVASSSVRMAEGLRNLQKVSEPLLPLKRQQISDWQWMVLCNFIRATLDDYHVWRAALESYGTKAGHGKATTAQVRTETARGHSK